MERRRGEKGMGRVAGEKVNMEGAGKEEGDQACHGMRRSCGPRESKCKQVSQQVLVDGSLQAGFRLGLLLTMCSYTPLTTYISVVKPSESPPDSPPSAFLSPNG